MKNILVALSLLAFSASVSFANVGGDEKTGKTEKKACCSKANAKSCTSKDKKACADKAEKTEKGA